MVFMACIVRIDTYLLFSFFAVELIHGGGVYYRMAGANHGFTHSRCKEKSGADFRFAMHSVEACILSVL